MSVKVSVIIPTYNRSQMLGITIKSFVEQDYPNDNYEILIVDNNSNDNTKDIVIEWKDKSTVTIKYIFEERQGVHYARNTAAKQSSGEILYYTDDDMIADKHLLKNIISIFDSEYKIASATGKILPHWETEPPKWILKYCYNGLLSLNDRQEDLIIAPFDIGVFSCHQAIRRDVFFESGGFNPENTAGEWIGDGETGLNIKIRELGYKFAYVGNSITYHMIPSSRMTQKYLNKRLANQGNCDCYTAYKQNVYGKGDLLRQIVLHIARLIKSILLAFLKVILLKDGWRKKWAYVYYYLNRIKYDLRLIKDEEWRKLVLKYDWLNE